MHIHVYSKLCVCVYLFEFSFFLESCALTFINTPLGLLCLRLMLALGCSFR